MILICVLVSALTPVIALLAWVVGWPILILVIGLAGATIAGRSVGFSSALLELAPAQRRSTYAATYSLISLPIAVMPLLGGAIIELFSYKILFSLTAMLMFGAVGAVWRWNIIEKVRVV
ncbi:MAG: hypothetical protein ISS70_18455 [Phycisphaerae bacterium]|nr:hypothetical protein [Phycisphaerae bacterium]